MSTLLRPLARMDRRPRRGLPDYDGQGWSPLDHVRPDSSGMPDLVCWYNPELSRGAASVGEQRADDAGPWGFDADTYTSSGGAYPTVEWPATLGGRPAWRFTGGKLFRYIDAGGANYGPTGTWKTLFLVAVVNGDSHHWPFSKSDGDAYDEATLALISTPYYDTDGDNGWVQAGSRSTGVGYVWVGINYSGGLHEIFRNLTSQGSRSTGSNGSGNRSAQINLGGARGVSLFFDGWIADAMIFRREFSAAEREHVTRKLAQRYGLSVG